MPEVMADGGRRLVTLDDLIDALDKRERALSNVPKVETFHFKGDRVSDRLDLIEQALVGLSDEVKLQRALRYVLHSHHREVSKVVDATNGSWIKFGDLMRRKYRLGDDLLTMANLEAMNKEDFSTIGAFVHEFKKKARKVHGISEEAQCATFLGLLTGSEAAELTKHGEGNEKLTWATIDKGVEEGSLDQVEEHKMRLQRRKRKERDATASGTPGVKRIVTDVLATLRTLMVETMKRRHCAYAFNDDERGRLDVDKIPTIRIHIVPHEPWNLRGTRYPNPDEEKKVVDYLDGKMWTYVADYSSGPYASPWFCFIKPNGTLRWVQDLQRLNEVTVRDAGGLPNVDALSESCARRPIISLIDLYSGYDQFPLYPSDRPVTAMHTPRGLIHMNVAPQGWTNAVAMVQRHTVRAIQTVSPHITQPYIDDLAVKGPKEREEDEVLPGVRRFVWKHIQDIDKVLGLLEEHNLTASGPKSKHCMREATILGFVCNEKGRRPDVKKTDKILEWSFVKDFATKTEHLRKLVRQDQEWVWGEDQEKAVERMKGEFMEGGLVLGAPNYEATEERPSVVKTDAGPTALGGVLIQADEDGKERPLRRLILRVDPTALACSLKSYTPSDPTIARWLTYIWMFNFELERIPGDKNRANGLSLEFRRITSEELRPSSPSPSRLELDIPGETPFRSLATHLDVSRWEASRLGEGSAEPVRYVPLEEPLDLEIETDMRDQEGPQGPGMAVEQPGPVRPQDEEVITVGDDTPPCSPAPEPAQHSRPEGIPEPDSEEVPEFPPKTTAVPEQEAEMENGELRVREMEVEHLTTQLAEERARNQARKIEWEKRFREIAAIVDRLSAAWEASWTGRVGADGQDRGMRASPSQGAAVGAPRQAGPMGEVPLDTAKEEGGTQESLMAMSTKRRDSILHELAAAMGIGTPQERPQRLDTPGYTPWLGELRAELGSWATETDSGGPDLGREQQQDIVSEPAAVAGSQPSGSCGDVEATERPHEERPRELGTPGHESVSTAVRGGENAEAMESEPRGHMGVPLCHEVTAETMGTPSASSSRGRKKKTVRWHDTSCFWCKEEGHRVVHCPELLEDKAEGRVAEVDGKFYDR
ncbi:hypothetical protein CBR_g12943 [Chara braunii]|uniref:Reverse transcriptase domain-containing protein n=1 Tax=Chara braunii TaxID=69332 RepID=A0A388KT53_CHABU|nr:hypothetical protein CBR_g12943 [Chara braunii]|eukprot:GBG73226.1 hypothetical protein CBR_g12943 [Chara braunii]